MVLRVGERQWLKVSTRLSLPSVDQEDDANLKAVRSKREQVLPHRKHTVPSAAMKVLATITEN